MRLIIAITTFFILALSGCEFKGTDTPFHKKNIIDLSYPYNEDTVFWPTAEEFKLSKGPEGVTERGYFYSANSFSMAEHGGTHIDAPYHFWEDGNTVDAIPPEQLLGEAVVVDVSSSALANPDYRVTVTDFTEWEQKHGRIPDGSIVLLRTGFGQYWPDPEQYMGTAERGEDAVADLHFPGLHPVAAEWIANERSIKLIGIDTPSIDYGQSRLYESHVALFKQNIPVLENVANLDKLPVTGFQVIALPMSIEGGSGSPVRITAILES